MPDDSDEDTAMTVSSPEFWIDAQLPPALASWLREEQEVQAIHVRDLGLITASDRRIFEMASVAGSVVVTKDSDFVVLLDGAPSPGHLASPREYVE